MNPVMIIGAVAATSAIPILAWTFLADGSGGGRRKVGAADLVGSTRSTGPSVDYRSAMLNGRPKTGRSSRCSRRSFDVYVV